MIAEVKFKQCENPLGAAYAYRETCQVPTCLSHELIESKLEHGIEFQFEYFILHLKSGLFETNNEINIAMINFKFLVNGGTLDLT